MTEGEIKKVAEDAAEGALRKFLLMIGVNVSTHDAMIELQRDFSHLRAERMTVGRIRDKIYTGLAGAAVSGVVAAIVFYIQKH